MLMILPELKRNLEMSAGVTLNWLNDKQMKVNPEKFQTLAVKQANEVNAIELNISGQTTKPTPCVNLLCMFIDDQLSFDKYVSKLCIRAALQTFALRTIVKYLSPESSFCGHMNSLKTEKVHKKSLITIFLLTIFSLKK